MTPEQLEAHRARFEQRFYAEFGLEPLRSGPGYVEAAASDAWQAYQWAVEDCTLQHITEFGEIQDGASTAPTLAAARKMGEVGGEASESERLAFEEWMAGHCWALSAKWDGTCYRGIHEVAGQYDPKAMETRRLWAAWRDRAALSHPESILADSGVIATTVDHVNAAVEMVAGAHPDKGTSAHAAPVVPAPVTIPACIHVTEAMHRAAVNVLHRAHGLDGLPQRMLDAMLAAAPPQAAPVAQLSEPPKGWKLMPIIPTDAMRDAGNEIIGNRSKLFKAYGAMLAAAPTTPKD